MHLLTTLAHTASLQLLTVSMNNRVVATTTATEIHRNIVFQPESQYIAEQFTSLSISVHRIGYIMSNGK
jgi:hypothetical protein